MAIMPTKEIHACNSCIYQPDRLTIGSVSDPDPLKIRCPKATLTRHINYIQCHRL
jgi:hypothetical protein